MAIPGLSTTIQDGGLGTVTPATSTAHVVGVFESGAFNTPTLISNQRQLSETFGRQGPGNECAGRILDIAGGPVVVTRTSEATAATYDGASTDNMVSDTGAGVDNEINLDVATSAPKNDFAIVVNVIVGGALATTTFQYSLDGGVSFSPTLAAGAAVVLGDSGVTLEFEAGATDPYVAGAQYTGTSKPATYSAANLTTAFAAITLSTLRFDFYVFAGEQATAAAAVTLFSTIATRLTAELATDNYRRAIMGCGDDDAATTLAAFSVVVSERITRCYGAVRATPVFPSTGRSQPHMPLLNEVAALAANNVMSTDLAQVAGAASVGAFVGAPSDGLSHNEDTQQAGLHDAKVATSRTYSNVNGAFLTGAPLASNVGSDFSDWQFGRVMDEACKAVSAQHTLLLNSSVATKTDGSGSITEASAQSIEKRVQRVLDAVIGSAARQIGPTNIQGEPGHVSDISYQVDRTNNILSTKTLIATVTMVPLGYIKQIQVTLSFQLAV